jgi:N-acetylneuraminic acid mutarotase
MIMPYLKTLLPQRICVLGGRNGLKVVDAFHAIDPATSAWEVLKPMKTGRNGCGTVVCRNNLYAVGGRNDVGKVTGEVQRYDDAHDRWVDVAKLQVDREKFACVEIRGGIYVVGGWGGAAGSLASMEYFNPDHHTFSEWTSLTPLSSARYACGGVAINGCLYVVGGLDNADQALSLVEVYDTNHGTWSKIPPMPTPRFDCGVAAVGGRLIVVGGRNNLGQILDVVECFDLQKGAWESLPPLVAPRFGCACASLGDTLYVFGGWDTDAVSRVEELDLGPGKMSTWNSRLPAMPIARGGCAVAILSS